MEVGNIIALTLIRSVGLTNVKIRIKYKKGDFMNENFKTLVRNSAKGILAKIRGATLFGTPVHVPSIESLDGAFLPLLVLAYYAGRTKFVHRRALLTGAFLGFLAGFLLGGRLFIYLMGGG